VREGAVVAVPDDRLGERACAVVVPEPGHDVTLARLTSFLAGREMATQFWPEHLDVRAELPRTETGKVKKYELRAQLSSTPPTESR
jgi:cyclohexanecarboxylate-CoA ligase